MSNLNLASQLNHEAYTFGDVILKSRLAQALNEGIDRYPIHRDLRLAARIELEILFDKIALDPTWQAQRLNGYSMLLDGAGCFVSATGGKTGNYSSCSFSIWAESPETAEQAKQNIIDHVGSVRIEEPMFSINWNFLTSKRELASAEIEELANDVLYDEAYPMLKNGVAGFIQRYLVVHIY